MATSGRVAEAMWASLPLATTELQPQDMTVSQWGKEGAIIVKARAERILNLDDNCPLHKNCPPLTTSSAFVAI